MKPCVQCGAPLSNGTERCDQCDVLQDKPIESEKRLETESPAEAKGDRGDVVFTSIVFFGSLVAAALLGFAGRCLIGETGLAIGVVIGLSPIVLWGQFTN